jgi:AraC family transcriptional regulator, melibiose operon regulatory protein
LPFGNFLRNNKVVPNFDEKRNDFESYGFACGRWTPAVMPHTDRHNEIELNLLEHGSLTYLRGGEKLTIQAGRLAVFWAAIPHQVIQFKDTTDYFVMTIPLVWFLQWRLPEHLRQLILHGRIVMEPDSARLPADLTQFQCWMEDVASPSEERHHISLLEVEARLRRLALRVKPNALDQKRRHSTTVLGRGSLSRVQNMASYIAEHYTEPLTIEMISQHVGLHPNYAMAVFHRVFGYTVISYLTQQRLSHAQRLLTTTEDKILDIALGSGFGSLSRFNEAFRRAFSCTPREFRHQHQIEQTSAGVPDPV